MNFRILTLAVSVSIISTTLKADQVGQSASMGDQSGDGLPNSELADASVPEQTVIETPHEVYGQNRSDSDHIASSSPDSPPTQSSLIGASEAPDDVNEEFLQDPAPDTRLGRIMFKHQESLAIDDLEGWRMHGRIEYDLYDYPFRQTIMRPDRMKNAVEGADHDSFIIAKNGTLKAWVSFPKRGLYDPIEFEFEEPYFPLSLQLESVVFWSKSYRWSDYEYIGITHVNDIPFHVIRSPFLEGRTILHELNRQGLEYARVLESTDPEFPVLRIEYRNFKMVGQRMLPFQYIVFADAEVVRQVTVESYHINKGIHEWIFE